MNVAVIEIKSILKYIIRIIITIALIIILISLCLKINISNEFLISCLDTTVSMFSYKKDIISLKNYDAKNILALELSVLNNIKTSDETKAIQENV